ncbi:MAG: ABC transporter ATP-binding protein [Janthinobacterium lividum]
MIETTALTKRYGNTTAVDDVTFTCRPGTITGFLGSNGAGKSTTLRMLTGLIPPTSGEALIDGVPYRALPNPARVVGVMLDASAQHPGRTGRETLRLAASLIGAPARRADAELERVGLSGAATKRVGRYSLGMRQRLGIAAALLGNPTALMLDEPANGLDPEGITWMRTLLRDFADEGGTVLLSSHLLREVQATADRLVVIASGRVVAQGPLDELLAGAAPTTDVRGPDPAALGAALSSAGLDFTAAPDGALRVQATPEVVGHATAAARQVVTELRSTGTTDLEEWFLHLTGGAPATTAA